MLTQFPRCTKCLEIGKMQRFNRVGAAKWVNDPNRASGEGSDCVEHYFAPPTSCGGSASQTLGGAILGHSVKRTLKRPKETLFDVAQLTSVNSLLSIQKIASCWTLRPSATAASNVI